MQARNKLGLLLLVGAVLLMATPGSPVPILLGRVLIRPGSVVASVGEAFERTVTRPFVAFRNKNALLNENEKLRAEINAMKNEMLLFPIIKEERDSLLALLGRSSLYATSSGNFFPQGTLASDVIDRAGSLPYDTINIDIGSSSGVTVGDVVLGDSSVAIGKVVAVWPAQSRVALYSLAGSSLDVMIGVDGPMVTVVGRGFGNLESKLPRDIEIETGDVLYLPGLEPRVVAVVGDIERAPADAFQLVISRSPHSLQELRTVFVLPSAH